MDKQALIDKMEQCRKFADDALADAYRLDNHGESIYYAEQVQSIYYAEQVLDAIDAFLNYLNGGDFHD